MTTQQNLAEKLFSLLEFNSDVHNIMDIILEIDDLNRWNIDIDSYLNYGFNTDEFIIDTDIVMDQYNNNIVPLNKGISMLEFYIDLWLIEGDYEFDLYPMMDEIIRFLVINGAKSSPKIYNKWLQKGTCIKNGC